MGGARVSLDREMVRRGLAENREAAASAIAQGRVRVEGVGLPTASARIGTGTPIWLVAPPRTTVSRGADKLGPALDRLGVAVAQRRALDAGASTGGFTNCLLDRGAAVVVAVDVGYGQLAWRLRQDPRVRVLDRTNVRNLTPQMVTERPNLVVADLSFISLRKVLPALVRVAEADADFVLLVKPQFEARRSEVSRGGLVRDPAIWRKVLREVCSAAEGCGLMFVGAAVSSVAGRRGNVEFFVHFGSPREGGPALLNALERAVVEASERFGDK
ncbi:MAG: TlyA family RNA methyltransferase [Actinomycetota bacterium]